MPVITVSGDFKNGITIGGGPADEDGSIRAYHNDGISSGHQGSASHNFTDTATPVQISQGDTPDQIAANIEAAWNGVTDQNGNYTLTVTATGPDLTFSVNKGDTIYDSATIGGIQSLIVIGTAAAGSGDTVTIDLSDRPGLHYPLDLVHGRIDFGAWGQLPLDNTPRPRSTVWNDASELGNQMVSDEQNQLWIESIRYDATSESVVIVLQPTLTTTTPTPTLSGRTVRGPRTLSIDLTGLAYPTDSVQVELNFGLTSRTFTAASTGQDYQDADEAATALASEIAAFTLLIDSATAANGVISVTAKANAQTFNIATPVSGAAGTAAPPATNPPITNPLPTGPTNPPPPPNPTPGTTTTQPAPPVQIVAKGNTPADRVAPLNVPLIQGADYENLSYMMGTSPKLYNNSQMLPTDDYKEFKPSWEGNIVSLFWTSGKNN